MSLTVKAILYTLARAACWGIVFYSFFSGPIDTNHQFIRSIGLLVGIFGLNGLTLIAVNQKE